MEEGVENPLLIIFSNQTSFLLGVVSAGGAGYYYLHRELTLSSTSIRSSVNELSTKVDASTKDLQKRVSALESSAKRA